MGDIKKAVVACVLTVLIFAAGAAPAVAGLTGALSEFRGMGEGSGLGLEEIPENTEADAAYNLGIKYYYGGAGNIKVAVEWFRKSAELGSAQGQFRLGAAYETGEGVEKDYAQALKWYRLSAEQKDKGGQYGLGRLYAKGRGVKRNYGEAARWFRLSAEQGVALAQYELGMMNFRGDGMKRNHAEAYFWLALAAKDIDDAMDKRDEAAERLSPDELLAARLRLREWKPAGAGSPADVPVPESGNK